MLKTTTYFPTRKEIKRSWYCIDAKDKVLGRLSTTVANILIGKGKVQFTPHRDCGDFVIVVNAKEVRLTGNKLLQKTHFHHSNYPGGAKIVPYNRLMAESPEKVIRLSVSRMLPKNKLRARMLKRLKIYAVPEHEHQAQTPVTVNL